MTQTVTTKRTIKTDDRVSVYRYNASGELMGSQDVTDWTAKEVEDLIQAIQNRSDGSWAKQKKAD